LVALFLAESGLFLIGGVSYLNNFDSIIACFFLTIFIILALIYYLNSGCYFILSINCFLIFFCSVYIDHVVLINIIAHPIDHIRF